MTFYKACMRVRRRDVVPGPQGLPRRWLRGPSNTTQYTQYLQAIRATGSEEEPGRPTPCPWPSPRAVGALYDGGITCGAWKWTWPTAPRGAVYNSVHLQGDDAVGLERRGRQHLRPRPGSPQRRASTSTTSESTARLASTTTTSLRRQLRGVRPHHERRHHGGEAGRRRPGTGGLRPCPAPACGKSQVAGELVLPAFDARHVAEPGTAGSAFPGSVSQVTGESERGSPAGRP